MIDHQGRRRLSCSIGISFMCCLDEYGRGIFRLGISILQHENEDEHEKSKQANESAWKGDSSILQNCTLLLVVLREQSHPCFLPSSYLTFFLSPSSELLDNFSLSPITHCWGSLGGGGQSQVISRVDSLPFSVNCNKNSKQNRKCC